MLEDLWIECFNIYVLNLGVILVNEFVEKYYVLVFIVDFVVVDEL